MNRRHFIRVNGFAIGGVLMDACMRTQSAPGIRPSPLAELDARSFAHARQFATTSVGRIAYVERGRGPATLFLHGYPLNGFQWRGAIDRLQGIRRCVAPDLMGLGYSDIPETQAITPDVQARMLVELLDSLRIDSCDVIANDSGGMIAQLLVMQAPQRVRSLLLTNCDTQNDCPPHSFRPFVRIARAGGLADRTIAPVLADKSSARTPRGIGGLGYSNPLNPTDEAIEMYFRPIVSSEKRQAQYDALTIGLGENALAGSAERLREFGGPVRIVWAADDSVFAKSSAAWLDTTFPNSRGVLLVPNAKLFFPEEQPDVIAAQAKLLWNA
jgi:pimeloyl-ACP methyl ester carboxylesterase